MQTPPAWGQPPVPSAPRAGTAQSRTGAEKPSFTWHVDEGRSGVAGLPGARLTSVATVAVVMCAAPSETVAESVVGRGHRGVPPVALASSYRETTVRPVPTPALTLPPGARLRPLSGALG
ncbi:hypothetical protein GCM10018782_53290 [Streptomyces griseoaurantiacus]|nr:hypothetical protein GCM10018782_53290 [Streptomyces griseoaurantiacus]